MSRGVKTLGGKHGDSRAVNSNSDFAGNDNQTGKSGSQDEFIAFDDEQPSSMRLGNREVIGQPKETPGEMGSSIPGIEAFQDPAQDPELVAIFQNLHFDYNSSLIKGNENILILQKISEWMKGHPGTYVFIEGHCDSRGPAAYNFALGANRANSCRNYIIKEGVSQDHLFTISYGKEKPLAEGEGEEIWSINRRAQFKTYQR
jgi:peptidoglycan-associated lipoprotein